MATINETTHTLHNEYRQCCVYQLKLIGNILKLETLSHVVIVVLFTVFSKDEKENCEEIFLYIFFA